jgi:hypothetical protein
MGFDEDLLDAVHGGILVLAGIIIGMIFLNYI